MDAMKETWMLEKWGYAYNRAINISNKKQRDLFFDERYYTNTDIKEFFEDLEFVNHTVWELIHIKLSKVCHNKKAEKRFNKWKSQQICVAKKNKLLLN